MAEIQNEGIMHTVCGKIWGGQVDVVFRDKPPLRT